MTSDDSTNVAISVAALAANPEVRVALRAGDGDVTAETQSLFKIGMAHDVLRLGAVRLAAAALAYPASAVFSHGSDTYVLLPDGGYRRFPGCSRADEAPGAA